MINVRLKSFTIIKLRFIFKSIIRKDSRERERKKILQILVQQVRLAEESLLNTILNKCDICIDIYCI